MKYVRVRYPNPSAMPWPRRSTCHRQTLAKMPSSLIAIAARNQGTKTQALSPRIPAHSTPASAAELEEDRDEDRQRHAELEEQGERRLHRIKRAPKRSGRAISHSPRTAPNRARIPGSAPARMLDATRNRRGVS